MAKTQAERIADLEVVLAQALLKINDLVAAQQPLAERVNEAHLRIDDAGKMFSALRRTLTPKREPVSAYIPPAEFDAAVAELRDEAGDERARFPIAAIRERALARRTLRENTAAAAV